LRKVERKTSETGIKDTNEKGERERLLRDEEKDF